jgi:putative addiction module antidote
MVMELKLRKIGNSIGLVLPKEALAKLKAGDGDTVTLTDESDGSLRLRNSDPEFIRQMALAEDIIKRYRNTLRELAK